MITLAVEILSANHGVTLGDTEKEPETSSRAFIHRALTTVLSADTDLETCSARFLHRSRTYSWASTGVA